MKQEDIQFLADLAKELKTQDNCGTKNPVWCIMDKKKIPVREGCGTYYEVYDYDECEAYTLEDFAKHFVEYYFPNWTVKDAKEVEEEILSCTSQFDLNCIIERYEDIDADNYDFYEVAEEEFITTETAGAFLTLRAAKKHLSENDYHYAPNARAYALSAWRNPELAGLLKIIKNTNWEELK